MIRGGVDDCFVAVSFALSWVVVDGSWSVVGMPHLAVRRCDACVSGLSVACGVRGSGLSA